MGDRLLEGHLAGADLDACVAAERARGTLPPGRLADRVLDDVRPTVEALAAEAAALRAEAGAGAGDPHSVDVNVRLPDGRSLVGTIPGVSGDLLLTVTYSSVAPKHRLATWVRFLALSAAHPARRFQAATVGRRRLGGPKRASVTTARVAPFGDGGAGLALHHLATLVDLYDRGLREPLPLYCATSAAWAQAIATGKDPEDLAAGVWESAYKFDGEGKDLEHQLVLGGVRPFADLLDAKPAEGEDGDGWDSAEPTRFGRYALRLWEGLLGWEVVVDK